jgi:hypothetical protein
MISAGDTLIASARIYPTVRTGHIKQLPEMTLQQSTFHITVRLNFRLGKSSERIQRCAELLVRLVAKREF